MSDDIVARLRGQYVNNFNALLWDEAADEIERLREQLRLANIDNFNTTAEIERLRDELVRNADEFRETLTELRQRVETLTAERDEARRAIIILLAGTDIAAMHRLADERGWDCFKEVPHD